MSQTIWSTPQSLFDKLNAEFKFDVDACADPGNQKCARFLDRDGSLYSAWGGSVWLNPPYGKDICLWMQKAYESAIHSGAIVVCLIPARTNAPWWHDFVMKADEIRLIRKKVAFTPNTDRGGVPFFGSVIAVFRYNNREHPKVSTYLQADHRGENGRRRTTSSNAKLGKSESRAPRAAGSNPADDHQTYAGRAPQQTFPEEGNA